MPADLLHPLKSKTAIAAAPMISFPNCRSHQIENAPHAAIDHNDVELLIINTPLQDDWDAAMREYRVPVLTIIRIRVHNTSHDRLCLQSRLGPSYTQRREEWCERYARSYS